MKGTAAAIGGWLLNGSLLGAGSAKADDYNNSSQARTAKDRGTEAQKERHGCASHRSGGAI